MIRYEFVLLDADDTLFDFQRSEREALTKVLAERGYPTDDATVALYSKINSSLWAANARGEVDLDFLTVERFATFMRVMGGTYDPRKFNQDYLYALGDAGYLLPGAVEFCQALRDGGCQLAIVTNGLPVAQWGRFNRSPLKDIIPHMFVSMELGYSKPQREYFDKVCTALKIQDRSRAVIMGDSLRSDVQGGQNAEIDTIWYAPDGQEPPEYPASTYTVRNYQQALELLLN